MKIINIKLYYSLYYLENINYTKQYKDIFTEYIFIMDHNNYVMKCPKYIMEHKQVSYIKTDDNKIINEKCIKWVKKMNECLEVCIRTNGCRVGVNTHEICKSNNPESYNKLNRQFD